MQMSSQPSTGQEAAGAMMLKKHRLQTVTAAEGTDAAMKKMSSGMGTEVVVEATGTALGEKNKSDMSAAGGAGMRTSIWKWVRMLAGTGGALGKSVIEEIKLMSTTGNMILILGFSLTEM